MTAKPSQLTNCPDCGHAVSRNAEACPSCGAKFRPSTRWTLFNLFFWFVMVAFGLFMLWLCGGATLGVMTR